MLRKDTNAEFLRHTAGFFAALFGWDKSGFRFSTGGRGALLSEVMPETQLDSILLRQQTQPIAVTSVGRKTWWMFEGQIWEEDDGLTAEELRLKLREREAKEAKKMQKLRDTYGEE